jgi:murein tripeptide amidase MpaA
VYENCSNIRVYKLSFDYNFEEEDDEVYFAYCIPYTYSQMLGDISRLSAEFVKKDNIGCSLSGVDIPILHITNHQVETDKKNILITGRIHPG